MAEAPEQGNSRLSQAQAQVGEARLGLERMRVNLGKGEGEGMAEALEQANSSISQAQAQVREVVDIMRVNVEEVLERDSKLSELDQRADNLQEGESVEMVEAKDDDGKIEYPVEHMVDFVQKPTQVLASFFISVTLGVFVQDTRKALKYQAKARRVRKSFKIQCCH